MRKETSLTACAALVVLSAPGLAQATGEKPTIHVSEATYGLNGGNNQAGNATDYLKQECDGKTSCSFPVSLAAGKIGDHFQGLPKDFDYTYVCGDKEKTGHVRGESNGKTAFLTCAARKKRK